VVPDVEAFETRHVPKERRKGGCRGDDQIADRPWRSTRLDESFSQVQ
jgi:hypothetical protein